MITRATETQKDEIGLTTSVKEENNSNEVLTIDAIDTTTNTIDFRDHIESSTRDSGISQTENKSEFISKNKPQLPITNDSDLNTDSSGYVTGGAARNSIYTLSASVKSTSEEVSDGHVTETVEFPKKETTYKSSEATVRASTRQQSKNYFIANVDFTTASGDDQLAATRKPVTNRNTKKTSPDGKRRRLVRRKRPSSTTEVQSEVVTITTTAATTTTTTTTATRPLRRPTGSLFNPNRVRQRPTTTITTTTEASTSSTASSQLTRKPGARVVRRRKYGPTTNRTRESNSAISEYETSESPTIAASDKGN
ncbi:hypothetical protein ANN_03972 [Periplaneta americana]|uniref:Uncharacterized protein n=1 Tax=Periplaneta americana TaxID=6978 RepID=A0ABQ8T8H3_PERAM|nr:hypothetical protein ANN_03972 [Periplaneta americana]